MNGDPEKDLEKIKLFWKNWTGRFLTLLFPKREEQDQFLSWIEYILVWLFFILICATALYFILYVLWGLTASPSDGVKERLQTVLSMLHQNWHIGLLVLVPLLFRPVRIFAENVQSFMGASRAPLQPTSKGKQDQIPPPKKGT